jgi:hypothetical protein
LYYTNSVIGIACKAVSENSTIKNRRSRGNCRNTVLEVIINLTVIN